MESAELLTIEFYRGYRLILREGEDAGWNIRIRKWQMGGPPDHRQRMPRVETRALRSTARGIVDAWFEESLRELLNRRPLPGGAPAGL